jgi:hypothetical protein
MAKQLPQAAPWEALGYEKRDVDATAARTVALFKGWVQPPDDPDVVPGWMDSIYLVASCAFALGAMGYAIKHRVLGDWREAGRRLVAGALYYFFGPWREKFLWDDEIDHERTRRLAWIGEYRNALAITLSLGDWTSADRLLDWPGPDLNDGNWYDEGCDDRTPEDSAYYIWLAMRLRGESNREVDARRDLIARRSRQRPKLLALAADALFDSDSDRFAKTLSDYLKHYRMREIDLRPTTHVRPAQDGICLDGTILWHLARRRRMGEVLLSQVDMLVIARP